MSRNGISCALSDGASESYDSKTWAKLLCQTFVAQSRKRLFGKFLKQRQIKKLITNSRLKFLEFFSEKKLSWSQKASYDRGSFASLIGVIDHGSSIEILAIGDTIALWQPTGESVKSFLLSETSEFEKQPLLISTIEANDEIFFKEENIRWSSEKIQKKDIFNGSIFLLTDAIAIKILDLIKKGEMSFALNLLKENHNDFEKWILSERNKKQIKTDDTTVVWININETS